MYTHVVVLPLLPLLEIVLFGLEFDNAFPELLGLDAQFVGGQVVDAEGLDADGEGDLLLFLELFLGLVTLELGTAETELWERILISFFLKNRSSVNSTESCHDKRALV